MLTRVRYNIITLGARRIIFLNWPLFKGFMSKLVLTFFTLNKDFEHLILEL